jgi:hypothetical protein
MFPDRFTGGGIDAYNLFALGLTFRLVAHDRVKLAAHHDGRRPAAELGTLPQDVAPLSALWIPLFYEPLFHRDPILLRPTPVGPIERIGRRREAGIRQRQRPRHG